MAMLSFFSPEKAKVLLNKISIYLRFFILTVLLTQFTACSLLNPQSNAVHNKNFARVMPLLPVPEQFQQKVWLEKFIFSLANDVVGIEEQANKVNRYAKQSMLLQTELTLEGINIAAMSFDGIPLAQASWKHGSQMIKSELTVAKNFDAKQVLHDLQIVNWPINIIAPTLAKGFSVDEQVVTDATTDRKKRIRRFYHQGEVIIIIHYQEKTIDFEQLSLGYQLSITRLNESHLKLMKKAVPSNK